ncbi:J domain-containing protein [Candidatus Dependentiae bacterium]|nr:J domain-containing protein [Candidatus Dependentiae bacterium]
MDIPFLYIYIFIFIVVFILALFLASKLFIKNPRIKRRTHTNIIDPEHYFNNKIKPIINITFYILELAKVLPYRKRQLAENIFNTQKHVGNLARLYIKENYLRLVQYIDDDLDLVEIHFDYENKLKLIRNLVRLTNKLETRKEKLINSIQKICRRIKISEHDYSKIIYSFDYKTSEEESFGDKTEAGLANSFQILGVSQDATFEEIKAHYRKLVRENHPDKFVDSSEMRQLQAQERMRELNWAYTTIVSSRKQQ